MINKVILVGNVGVDPEIRTTESRVKMARIRLATTERIFNRQTNEGRDHTEWHTVIVWRNLADLADKYIRKGSQIYVEGNLRSREWVDKDNVKHFVTEIAGYDLKLLGRKSENTTESQQSQPQASTPPTIIIPKEDDPDDIPF